jgi:branched-chain amino acid transport system ATP-binding protein
MGSADEGLLEVRGLIVNYGPVRALRGVTLHVPEGQTVTLIGANGAGKTTTLAALSGLVRPAQGSIRFAGLEIAGWRPPRIVDLGLIQVPEGRAILPQMSVQENLQLGGYRRRDRGALAGEVRAMQERFPILGQRRDLPAGSLSGGEQQLLAIARGLLARPRLLLLDEPSMGLAPILVEKIFEIIQTINGDGTTVLLVEQNALMALQIANRGYVLETGKIALADDATALANNERVRKAYLGES